MSNFKSEELFNKNPVFLVDLIGKTAHIETDNTKNHIGAIHTIDPMSKTVVLIHTAGDKTHLEIIPAHAIKSFFTSDEVLPGISSSIKMNNVSKNQERKNNIKNWLNQNRIKVTESNDRLLFEEHLVIEPPYDKDHIYCSNTIVLERVLKILDNLPENFGGVEK